MDRFSAYLLVRRFLRRPDSRNQALAVEAIMQELAAHASETGELWGLLGLLSQLDLEYAESNPRARGVVARQQAELEGLEAEHAVCLERWCAPGASVERPPVEDALVVASLLGAVALGRPPDAVCDDVELEEPAPTLETEGDDSSERSRRARAARRPTIELDDDLGARLGRELDLRRQQGDPQGDRLDEALTRLRLDGHEAGRLALAGLRRAVQDFR